jgi:hypothetical protein
VDPVPDPLLFSGSAGNRTRASGSVAKNSDHQTTEAQRGIIYSLILRATECKINKYWQFIFHVLPQLYVHSTDDMPLIGRSKAYWVFRGSERQVYVQHKQTVASPELRRLNPYQRRCLFRDEVEYSRSSSRAPALPVYTYNLCNMACRRRVAWRFCSCIPFFYRTLGQ